MWLLACAPPPCAEGSTERPDGVCVRVQPAPWEGEATVQEALDALPPCTVASGDGRIDLDSGCVDEACAGMTAVEISEALGEPAACTPWIEPRWEETYAECAWPSGIEAWFADFDADGTPDADQDSYGLDVVPPFAGSSTDGFGLGAEFTCFLDAWGEPERLELLHDGDAWRIAGIAWDDAPASVSWDPVYGAWDGTPAGIYVY